jgi:CRP-like cAMP-binding protein
MDLTEQLRRIPLFADLDEPALARIGGLVTEFSAAADHVLVEKGHPGNGMFVLEDGWVAVEPAGGKRIELGPGEFFGELSLLTDRPRSARVRTLTDVTCLAIRRQDFVELLESEPQLTLAMLHGLALRVTDDRAG